WRKPFNIIHVRLIKPPQKLPRVSRERFDIAPLAFGKNRVKSQARFARTRKPRKHNHFVAWNLEIYVLEIVLTRALDDNFLFHKVGNWKMGYGIWECEFH